MSKILLINGPNLNLLGTREPAIYGSATLPEIERDLQAIAEASGAGLTAFQSNHEGALIDRIHQARLEGVSGIIINAGAYTHTSIALRDALAATAIPFIEVHISNVHEREPFRSRSYLSDIALGTLCGMGVEGYRMALKQMLTHIQAHP